MHKVIYIQHPVSKEEWLKIYNSLSKYGSKGKVEDRKQYYLDNKEYFKRYSRERYYKNKNKNDE